MRNFSTKIFLLNIGLSLASGLGLLQAQDRRTLPVEKITPALQAKKAGAFIDVNAAGYPESNYTISQLIKDVLISGGDPCITANVSNVTVSPNLAVSNPNRSYGFFSKGTTAFPFAKGIVLSTGHAYKTGNTFYGQLNDVVSGNGVGDADLAAAIGVGNSSLNDATYIEFDFVPTTSQISFRYIFASEEYSNNYPCTFTDGFALLLKKVGDPNYTNLAVLPGGAGPVSVTNIRPQITGAGGCNAVNQAYFAGYNTANVETNFNGRTVPLTAVADVIPGETYHFKMVLADFGQNGPDTSYDSAVFLEAGSFDIGVNLTDSSGNPLPASINVCDNEPQLLAASVQGPGITFQWFHNNSPIPGATNNSYSATLPGTYTLEVTFPASTCPVSASIEIVGGSSPAVQNTSLSACYVSGSVVFDLTSAQATISTVPGASFDYYTTLADAQAANTNTIPNPTAYNSVGNQTIYVLVKSGFCSSIAQLQLVKTQEIIPSAVAPQPLTCSVNQATIDASGSQYPAGSTFAWTTGTGNIVSGSDTLTPMVNAPGTYTLTITYTPQGGGLSCTKTLDVVVTGDTAPPNVTLTASSLKICAGQTVSLTASGASSYTWENLPGTGNTQVVSPTTTTTYSVVGHAANGCPAPVPTTITIEVLQPFTAQNAILAKCYSAAGNTFDLTSAQPTITTEPGVTFTYYNNLADAQAGNANFINATTNYPTNTSQTIYVLVSNSACTQIVELQLVVGPAVVLQIVPPQTLTCLVNQLTLNASNSTLPTGAIIQWTTTGGNIISGANTLQPVINQGGIYTLTVTVNDTANNLNCVYTQNVTINNDLTLPTASLTSSVPRICEGESLILTASGGATYEWVGLPGTGNTQTVSPTTTTTYQVYAIGANGCRSATPATITVQVGPPVASVMANQMSICEGESVTLTAGGGVSYNWVGLPGSGNTQVVSPMVTTTYQVYALGGNGCSSIDPATITIEVIPAITSTLEDVIVCAGDFGTLDAGSNPNYTYIWNTGETTPFISTNIPGVYTVTISNGVCTKSYSAQLINPELPQIIDAQYVGTTLTLSATNSLGGTLEYSINNGVTWQTSNVFYNVMPNINYELRVRLKDAKCSTGLTYYAFQIVNAITPNQDGHNDYVDFVGISKYNYFAASIFDRHGSEVFRASQNETRWDGTVGGFNLQTETYWYKVQWENPASKKIEVRTGWILVKNRN